MDQTQPETEMEPHRSHRSSRLRAAVLGANDGIVSTASLIIGFAASNASTDEILLAGVAGLVAGAMSMAAGEYVSVSSQADSEQADIELEKLHLDRDSEGEEDELAQIYINRGLKASLAHQVAKQLMAHDALDAHARDELGIFERVAAKPVQAAVYSFFTFSVGAAVPLLAVGLASPDQLVVVVALMSLICLALLGGLAARAGGARILKGALRVTFWGAMAMALTALTGYLFDVAAGG